MLLHIIFRVWPSFKFIYWVPKTYHDYSPSSDWLLYFLNFFQFHIYFIWFLRTKYLFFFFIFVSQQQGRFRIVRVEKKKYMYLKENKWRKKMDKLDNKVSHREGKYMVIIIICVCVYESFWTLRLYRCHRCHCLRGCLKSIHVNLAVTPSMKPGDVFYKCW